MEKMRATVGNVKVMTSRVTLEKDVAECFRDLRGGSISVKGMLFLAQR